MPKMSSSVGGFYWPPDRFIIVETGSTLLGLLGFLRAVHQVGPSLGAVRAYAMARFRVATTTVHTLRCRRIARSSNKQRRQYLLAMREQSGGERGKINTRSSVGTYRLFLTTTELAYTRDG